MSTISIKINGNFVDLIEPTVFEISRSDLYSDSSSRSSETGDMMLYPIKYGVYTLTLEFVGTPAEIKSVENLITGRCGFTVKFIDYENSAAVQKKMYASDRKKVPLGTPASRKYRLSFNLIETGDV